jgi:catecholate siderophore receptor
VNEFDTGSLSHTLMIGGQIVDTDNSNYRYDSYWTTSGKDKETFNMSDPLNISVNSAGDPTRVDFYTKMNRSTTFDIEV